MRSTRSSTVRRTATCSRSATESGTPILLRNVATVSLGPELRRGLTDLDGLGETAAGVVIMRFGENALETIRNVKARLAELSESLPPGVEIVPVYDRAYNAIADRPSHYHGEKHLGRCGR